MQREIGDKEAKIVGYLHEICDDATSAERAMDLYNNLIGIAVGRSGADCRDTCLKLANTMLKSM